MNSLAQKSFYLSIIIITMVHFAFVNCNDSKIPNFIAKLLNLNKLSHCSVTYYTQQLTWSFDVLSSIASLQTNQVFLNFAFISSNNQNHLNQSHNLNIGELLGLNNRKVSRCKLVIVIIENNPINSNMNEFFNGMYRKLSPVFSPLVLKGRDRFIILTKTEEQMNYILSKKNLAASIKYKIALTMKGSHLTVKSLCFFCNNGKEQILNILPPLVMEDFEYFPDYVTDLKGSLLRISHSAIVPRIETQSPWEGIGNAKRGMYKNLIEEYLIPKFNFTYNIFLSTGLYGEKGFGSSGTLLKNGTWIGTVGDLLNGRAEMAITTAETPIRVKAISFTNTYFDITNLRFIVKEGVQIFTPKALLWPFDFVMWLGIFLSTITALGVFGLLTFITHRLGMRGEMSFTRRGQISNSGEEWGLGHQLIFIVTSYLEQDCIMPKATPLRCFSALWLFFTLIISTGYRSKMVSFLAFPVLETIPRTFEDLVNAPGYKIGFIKHGDSAYNTIKASTDPVYVKIVREMEIVTGAGLECINRVVSNKYGCIAYNFAIEYLKSRNLSDSDMRKLVWSSDVTYNICIGLAFPAGSILKEGFEKWLGWTRAFHFQQIWEERDMYNLRLPKLHWWKEHNEKDKLIGDELEGKGNDLTLDHISGAFYAKAIGMIFSSIVFIQELMYFYGKQICVKGYSSKRAFK